MYFKMENRYSAYAMKDGFPVPSQQIMVQPIVFIKSEFTATQRMFWQHTTPRPYQVLSLRFNEPQDVTAGLSRLVDQYFADRFNTVDRIDLYIETASCKNELISLIDREGKQEKLLEASEKLLKAVFPVATAAPQTAPPQRRLGL